ncbi:MULTISPECIES: hypothetical protein [Candidatus Nitrosocaldus]|jgi:hypothetical protein|uniref:Uncharacterized protein n=1 Tax=Candidatus Nitrosocaldus cavascurensis TaxID=2058097 RepID=A0A2K5AQC7_9ARCH|nr:MULTISPECIES: hypothetical protein [Candidatus Nitrosocaldus]SPC33856.1 conserved protein of unknown function [Candidatus Nitrosocaldus cavascurensis]
MKRVRIRSSDELINMSRDELMEYLRDYDGIVKQNDRIEVIHLKHGIKVLYYHKNENRPYKTQVYMKKARDCTI